MGDGDGDVDGDVDGDALKVGENKKKRKRQLASVSRCPKLVVAALLK